MNDAPGVHRTHIVMVPGFAGFDVLGQLEYYSGVTSLLAAWQREHPGRGVVLHYFDNFPTACVATRAARLRQYLAKRLARGEFQAGDSLALVGHSTGGLDIRRLLCDLSSPSRQRTEVDGDVRAAVPVESSNVLKMIDAVVFLSVPQWGTNIADWVQAHPIPRVALIADLRVAVEAATWPVIGGVPALVASGAAVVTGTELSIAVEDSLREIDPNEWAGNDFGAAAAREAASKLQLWLAHASADFSVIGDLTSRPPQRPPVSPAHFTQEMREAEKTAWREAGIRTRSYATLGPRPPLPDAAVPGEQDYVDGAPSRRSEEQGERAPSSMDLAYRVAYRACAAGPFSLECDASLAAAAKEHGVEAWDSDGIVNTASMFWPDADRTIVVPADHMDIVGHYKLVRALPGSGREYHTYDLLGSDSGFSDAAFAKVWSDVFDFCA